MSWLLCLCCCCCCCLLLIDMSGALLVLQVPRFLGYHPGRRCAICCLLPKPSNISNFNVSWFRHSKFDEVLDDGLEVTAGERIQVSTGNSSVLTITRLQEDDSGVYVCRVNQMRGSGTALRVARSVNLEQRSYRSKVKDGLIILQGLLLAGCVTALMLRNRTLLEENDSVYEEPEMDHIYEGLTIETCGGGGLYEELSLYTQPQTTEAPWQ
ncbi:B-cell antigen receptor complex-associated protein beta chain [Nelusetta ayraudi]|uniref:B-cell antigen receptor complex-associated protein beta chain n=1 Tax=Nelusetta ayraudi TaxID=303726 RepID=UPI003F706C03